MITVTVVNQKGGIAKTTTAITLGHGMALRGYRVLVVDLDPQGNIADCLGMQPGNDLMPLLMPGSNKPLADCVTPSGRTGLDVLRSDKMTVNLKLIISSVTMREYVLDNVLNRERAGYDLAILDCAPSVDVLMTAAIVASHYLLIPTRLDQLSVKGVRELLDSLTELRRITTCKIGGILPTFYDRQTKESYAQLQHLVRTFGELVWPPIPQDTVCRESSRVGKTLWEYEPNTRAMTGHADSNGALVGGYVQALDRFEEKFFGKRRKK